MVMARDPDKPYREYQPMHPIKAAQVKIIPGKVSLEDIARWCDGEVVRAHSKTSKAIGIRLHILDGGGLVPMGDYIIGTNDKAFFSVTEAYFINHYRRWTKREQAKDYASD